QHGMSVVDGQCPFMFLPQTMWFHRMHGFIKKVSGSYPPAN
ncbi:MAG: CoA-binding protein, partial [Chloroflexi bacterium]|nr:CoA-binding protein [Chloroflexota bacterium]